MNKEVIVLVGAPCIGKTFHYYEHYRITHAYVHSTEGEHDVEGGTANTFSLLLKEVVNHVSAGRQRSVVVDNRNDSYDNRLALKQALESKLPGIKVIFKFIQPIVQPTNPTDIKEQIQCLWAYAWKLAENADRVQRSSSCCAYRWVSDSNPTVWFRSHNPLPTTSEGGCTVKVGLVCNSKNPRALLSHPVLFVQLRAIYNVQTCRVADTSDLLDATNWINDWLIRNTSGRLIIMINGQSTIGTVAEGKYKTILSQCASFFVKYPIYYVVLPDSWQSVLEYLTPGIIAWLQRRHRLDLFNEESCYVHRTKQHEDLANAAFLKRRSYKYIDKLVRGDSPPGWLMDCDVRPGRNPPEDRVQNVPLIDPGTEQRTDRAQFLEETDNGLFVHGLFLNGNDIETASKTLTESVAASSGGGGRGGRALTTRGRVTANLGLQSGIAPLGKGPVSATVSTTVTKPPTSSPAVADNQLSSANKSTVAGSSGMVDPGASKLDESMPSGTKNAEGMRAVVTSYGIRPKVSTKTAPSGSNVTTQGIKRKNRIADLVPPISPSKSKRAAGAADVRSPSKPTAQGNEPVWQSSEWKNSEYHLWRPSQDDIRACALAFLQQKSELSKKYNTAQQSRSEELSREGAATKKIVRPERNHSTSHDGSQPSKAATSSVREPSAKDTQRSRPTTSTSHQSTKGPTVREQAVSNTGMRRSSGQTQRQAKPILRTQSAPGSQQQTIAQKEISRFSGTSDIGLDQASFEQRKALQKAKKAQIKAKLLARKKGNG